VQKCLKLNYAVTTDVPILYI